MVQLAVLPLALYLPLLLVSVLTAPLSMGLFVRSLVRRHPQALWSMTALFCFAQIQIIQGQAYVVYRFDRDDHPVFP